MVFIRLKNGGAKQESIDAKAVIDSKHKNKLEIVLKLIL